MALIMTAAIWILQVVLSSWWLKHHRFGPLEWLLRRFTYGKTMEAKRTGKEKEFVAVAEGM
jgi:uncharacterized protein